MFWDGGGVDNHWTTAENWVGDVAPVANDELVFPISALQKTSVNDFPFGMSFGSILLNGSSYNLGGNPIVLNGSASSNGSGNTSGVAVQLGTNGGFANTVGSTNVWTGNVTSGTYMYLRPGSGSTLQLNGAVSTANSSIYVADFGKVAFNGSFSCGERSEPEHE